jgi:hypothetical protein
MSPDRLRYYDPENWDEIYNAGRVFRGDYSLVEQKWAFEGLVLLTLFVVLFVISAVTQTPALLALAVVGALFGVPVFLVYIYTPSARSSSKPEVPWKRPKLSKEDRRRLGPQIPSHPIRL